MTCKNRKADILVAGLAMWPNVTARAIARELNTTHSACTYHFGSVDALRDAVAAYAVRIGDARVVPMLITAGHEAAAVLGQSERRRYLLGV